MIQINKIPVVDILDFAEQHNLVLVVDERRTKNLNRYIARFKDVEVKDGGMLHSLFGSGESPQQAICNYVAGISIQTLVIGAYTPSRREIEVPRLTSTKIGLTVNGGLQ